MLRLIRVLAALTILIGIFTACGGESSANKGPRLMHGSWNVRIDPDRTIKLELNGSFDVTQDKTDAKSGETEVEAKTYGIIKATNMSDGRNVKGIKTGLEVFVPIAACPDWDENKGAYCARDLLSFKVPNLNVDETKSINISGTKRVAAVPEAQGQAVIDSMLNPTGVVVSADRVYWNHYLEELNPTCTFDDDGKWVTYFTENQKVTACSTETKTS